ncbi:unnamed protein product, partial [Polarella glacialis]
MAANLSQQLRPVLDQSGSGRVSRRIFEEVIFRSAPGFTQKELEKVFAGFQEAHGSSISSSGSDQSLEYVQFLSWLFDERLPSSPAVSGAASRGIWSLLPGLGNEPFPGFPCDVAPAALPDLGGNLSPAAEVFRRDPWIYLRLKDLRSAGGFGIARCVKPGFDAPRGGGLGAVACDASCYEVFWEFFGPVLKLCHPRLAEEAAANGLSSASAHLCSKWLPAHPVCLSSSSVRAVRLDRAVKVRVGVTRCLRGVPFPPASSREQKQEVERLLSDALGSLAGSDLVGKYRPFAAGGST